MILSSLGDMEAVANSCQMWDRGKNISYTLNGMEDDSDVLAVVTDLVRAGAFERDGNDDDADKALVISSSDARGATLARLQTQGAVIMLGCEAALGTKWQLTSIGATRLEMVHNMRSPTYVFQLPDPLPPLCDLSRWSLLAVMDEDQWEWRRHTARVKAYTVDSAKVAYQKGTNVTVHKEYLLALLDAGSLHVPIEHGRSDLS